MLRRAVFMHLGWAMASAAGLTGCGFHLRDSGDFAFQTIAVTPQRPDSVASDLVRYLGNAVRPAAGANAPAPDVTLEILEEAREKSVVGANTSGQVREFQLRMRVRFRLRNAMGQDLLRPTEILQQRDMGYSETAALAKEAEEALLYRDMRGDTVQQILRRLSAVKSLAL